MSQGRYPHSARPLEQHPGCRPRADLQEAARLRGMLRPAGSEIVQRLRNRDSCLRDAGRSGNWQAKDTAAPPELQPLIQLLSGLANRSR